jgi:acyl-CoA thioesterase FadM
MKEIDPSNQTTPVSMNGRHQAVKYEHRLTVTFCHTNAEGNVSHDQYAKIFGIVRELFGLDFIPRFKEEAGRLYLLKTKNATYDYRRDFFFGDKMMIRMGVAEINGASFTLEAEFIHKGTGEVRATGRQQIVYTDMTGKPKRMPLELKALLYSVVTMQEAVPFAHGSTKLRRA